jgi:chromosome segregation ATPase
MAMTNERVITDMDLNASLSQMAEATTAAELVRTQGQTKKVKVLSQRKLTEWIQALLNQHLASRTDSFSDQEKEELLRKTQEELARRIQREQEAERERSRIAAQLEGVMAQISENRGDQTAIDEALSALRAQLAEAQAARSDQEQDLFEVQDQLQEKLNLLSSTIAEKDRLRDVVRNQMLRSNALVEGVLGLDAEYYQSRHQEQNPVIEDTSDEERFYHDFDVGALVIQTLSQDLGKLQQISGQLGEDAGDQRTLAKDLELLSELKAGSLHALDVAAPVSGLIEALSGVREQTEAIDETVSAQLGSPAQPISALPDPDGEPSAVLAGATTVLRELASELARNRNRIAALQNLAEEADAERNSIENEIAALREAHQALYAALANQAPANLAAILVDEQADEATRRDAASRLSSQSTGDNSLTRTLAQVVFDAAREDEQLADVAADLALSLDPANSDDPALGEQLVQGVTSLARRKQELARDLAAHSEQSSAATGRVVRLRQDLDATAAKAEELAAREQARQQADRQLAATLVEVAKTDDLLADVITDLSVALDDDIDPLALPQQLARTVTAIAERQQSLSGVQQRSSLDGERQRHEATEAKHALSETQQAVIALVREAAPADAELAALAQQLDQAGAQLRPGEPLPPQHQPLLQSALQQLGTKIQESETERAEVASHGREIISTLSAARDQREAELRALRSEHDTAIDRIATLESRAAAAESATRTLAEALAQNAHGDIAKELEKTLAELPDDGEDGIDLPADLAQRIAAAGLKIIAQHQQTVAALATAKASVNTLTAQTETQRRELQTIRDQVQKALEQERAKNATLNDELGKALSEKVELNQQLRKLSGN